MSFQAVAGVVIPNNALQKMQEMKQVNHQYSEANKLYLASASASSTRAASELQELASCVTAEADRLAQEYYQKYPNCLSRNLSPWAK